MQSKGGLFKSVCISPPSPQLQFSFAFSGHSLSDVLAGLCYILRRSQSHIVSLRQAYPSQREGTLSFPTTCKSELPGTSHAFDVVAKPGSSGISLCTPMCSNVVIYDALQCSSAQSVRSKCIDTVRIHMYPSIVCNCA